MIRFAHNRLSSVVLHFSEFETKGNLTDQMIFIHLIQAQYSYSTTLVLQFL